MKSSKNKNKSKKKIIIFVLCIAAAIALVMFGIKLCNDSLFGGDDNGKDETITATVERMDISQKISFDGEITTALKEKKTPHVSYKLEKIQVEEGQAVQEGDTILVYTNGAVMTAPYDCAIVEWNLPDPKKTITNDHYVEIASTRVLKMELSVNEDEIFMIERGDQATIKIPSIDKKYKGEVSFISDIGDYSDGISTFKVEVILDNDGSLKLGMKGKATITLAKVKNILAVPVDAVHYDGESSFVSVQRGDSIDDTEEVEVTTGLKNDKFIEIKTGIEEGDVVVYTQPEEDEWGDEI